jgi:hypothetical protein
LSVKFRRQAASSDTDNRLFVVRHVGGKDAANQRVSENRLIEPERAARPWRLRACH